MKDTTPGTDSTQQELDAILARFERGWNRPAPVTEETRTETVVATDEQIPEAVLVEEDTSTGFAQAPVVEEDTSTGFAQAVITDDQGNILVEEFEVEDVPAPVKTERQAATSTQPTPEAAPFELGELDLMGLDLDAHANPATTPEAPKQTKEANAAATSEEVVFELAEGEIELSEPTEDDVRSLADDEELDIGTELDRNALIESFKEAIVINTDKLTDEHIDFLIENLRSFNMELGTAYMTFGNADQPAEDVAVFYTDNQIYVAGKHNEQAENYRTQIASVVMGMFGFKDVKLIYVPDTENEPFQEKVEELVVNRLIEKDKASQEGDKPAQAEQKNLNLVGVLNFSGVAEDEINETQLAFLKKNLTAYYVTGDVVTLNFRNENGATQVVTMDVNDSIVYAAQKDGEDGTSAFPDNCILAAFSAVRGSHLIAQKQTVFIPDTARSSFTHGVMKAIEQRREERLNPVTPETETPEHEDELVLDLGVDEEEPGMVEDQANALPENPYLHRLMNYYGSTEEDIGDHEMRFLAHFLDGYSVSNGIVRLFFHDGTGTPLTIAMDQGDDIVYIPQDSSKKTTQEFQSACAMSAFAAVRGIKKVGNLKAVHLPDTLAKPFDITVHDAIQKRRAERQNAAQGQEQEAAAEVYSVYDYFLDVLPTDRQGKPIIRQDVAQKIKASLFDFRHNHANGLWYFEFRFRKDADPIFVGVDHTNRSIYLAWNKDNTDTVMASELVRSVVGYNNDNSTIVGIEGKTAKEFIKELNEVSDHQRQLREQAAQAAAAQGAGPQSSASSPAQGRYAVSNANQEAWNNIRLPTEKNRKTIALEVRNLHKEFKGSKPFKTQMNALKDIIIGRVNDGEMNMVVLGFEDCRQPIYVCAVKGQKRLFISMHEQDDALIKTHEKANNTFRLAIDALSIIFNMKRGDNRTLYVQDKIEIVKDAAGNVIDQKVIPGLTGQTEFRNEVAQYCYDNPAKGKFLTKVADFARAGAQMVGRATGLTTASMLAKGFYRDARQNGIKQAAKNAKDKTIEFSRKNWPAIVAGGSAGILTRLAAGAALTFTGALTGIAATAAIGAVAGAAASMAGTRIALRNQDRSNVNYFSVAWAGAKRGAVSAVLFGGLTHMLMPSEAHAVMAPTEGTGDIQNASLITDRTGGPSHVATNGEVADPKVHDSSIKEAIAAKREAAKAATQQASGDTPATAHQAPTETTTTEKTAGGIKNGTINLTGQDPSHVAANGKTGGTIVHDDHIKKAIAEGRKAGGGNIQSSVTATAREAGLTPTGDQAYDAPITPETASKLADNGLTTVEGAGAGKIIPYPSDQSPVDLSIAAAINEASAADTTTVEVPAPVDQPAEVATVQDTTPPQATETAPADQTASNFKSKALNWFNKQYTSLSEVKAEGVELVKNAANTVVDNGKSFITTAGEKLSQATDTIVEFTDKNLGSLGNEPTTIDNGNTQTPAWTDNATTAPDSVPADSKVAIGELQVKEGSAVPESKVEEPMRPQEQAAVVPPAAQESTAQTVTEATTVAITPEEAKEQLEAILTEKGNLEKMKPWEQHRFERGSVKDLIQIAKEESHRLQQVRDYDGALKVLEIGNKLIDANPQVETSAVWQIKRELAYQHTHGLGCEPNLELAKQYAAEANAIKPGSATKFMNYISKASAALTPK